MAEDQQASRTPPAPADSQPEGPRHVFGFRATAVAEIAVFISLALLLDRYVFDADAFFDVRPHPFWLIVLLLAVQYGTAEGLLAAAVCTVALLGVHFPERALTEDLYAWMLNVLGRPLGWASVAVVFGELRSRQLRERERLRTELATAQERSRTIAAAYERLDEIREQLEVRVAGQLRSVLSMYQAAKAVETMEPARVLLGALDNVRAVMNPKKCSIFVLGGDELQAGIQTGWERSDKLARRFRSDSRLFQEVVGKGRVLCVADPDDEQVLAGEGVMAGPLVNPHSGEVRGMLKVEDMGFLGLNLSTVELFRAVCDWVGAFYANAQRYRRGRLERAVDTETQLYAPAFYPRLASLLRALSERAGFPVAVLHLTLDDPYRLDREQRTRVAAALGRAVQASLRDTDVAFERDDATLGFTVVLPLASPEHASIVGARLEAAFAAELPEGLGPAPLSMHSARLEDEPPAPAAARAAGG